MLDVIDLSGLGSGDPAALRRVAAELGRACRETGFFYIRNHGVADDLVSGLFNVSRSVLCRSRCRKG